MLRNLLFTLVLLAGSRCISGKTKRQNSGCGGTLTNPNGRLSSPGYPEEYPNNQDCYWNIVVAETSIITLEFQAFDLEESSSCGYDWLAIRQGNTSTPNTIKYCGDNRPERTVTESNTLTVYLHTDHSVTRPGFQASYTSQPGCRSTLTEPQGRFNSPNYPDNYPDNADCTWNIQVEEGYIVHLRFHEFKLESGNADGCVFDWVEVFDYTSGSLGRFCGWTIPDDIVSSSNNVSVRLHTDHGASREGFYITYWAVLGPTCGGVLSGDSGIITSPGYPNNYPNNAQCNWTIPATEGQTITVNFTSFLLESSDHCGFDWVRIHKLNTYQSYCGREGPSVIRSDGDSLVIEFHSDDSFAKTGFRATYTKEVTGPTCGGVLSGDSGIITSPGYPDSYPNNAQCNWTIPATEGQTITINFTSFHLEHSGHCVFDWLRIHNSTAYQSYCGIRSPGLITSGGNTLVVEFHSDSSVTKRGFRATYSVVSDTCGGTLSGQTGVIMSPNYPQPYPMDTDCVWTIQAPQVSVVDIVFQDFVMEGGRRCPFDWLQVLEGATDRGKFCGTTPPSGLRPSANLTLRFHSDGSISRRGFKATYTTRVTN